MRCEQVHWGDKMLHVTYCPPDRVYTTSFWITPSRCFIERSCPTAKNALSVRDVTLFLMLPELDANSWTTPHAGGVCPTGPPPFTLGINFFVGYHLHSREHSVVGIVASVMQVLGFEAQESAHPFELTLVRGALSLKGAEQLTGVEHEQAFGWGCYWQDSGEPVYRRLDGL